jgi:hypothetical protein
MARAAFVMTMLALLTLPCASRAGQHDAQACLVEVLYSEMLPAAPPFYHTVKTRLLVTSADRVTFETTVVRTIPWQAPPPRQGQRDRVACEQVSALSGFHLF